MTTDNRANEPTEAQVEAAVHAAWAKSREFRGVGGQAEFAPPWEFQQVIRAALVAAQGAAPTDDERTSVENVLRGIARVVPNNPVTSACASGYCPSGCSHMMWKCDTCQCEGGWGAPVGRLEDFAADHACPEHTAPAYDEPMDLKVADLIWDTLRDIGAEPRFEHDEHGELDADGVFIEVAGRLLSAGFRSGAPAEPAPTLRDHVRALTGATDAGLDELGGFTGEPAVTDEMAEHDRQVAALSPPLNRVRAEALRTYAQKRYLAFLEFPERDWLDQPEGTARHYAKVAADMLAEADRIEQNSEGNET